MHLFGWGDPVDVFITFTRNGAVNGVFPVGEEDRARLATELPYYERWTVAMPEAGPLRIWTMNPDVATRDQHHDDKT